MKAQTKSALLLFATLLVGVLLGVLGASTLHSRRVEQIRSTFERRGGITDMFEEVIQPADDAQRTQIRAALEQTEVRFREIRRECRDQFVASRDAMRADLNPVLTPAQQPRLDEWLKRDRDPFRGGRGGREGRRNRGQHGDDDNRRPLP